MTEQSPRPADETAAAPTPEPAQKEPSPQQVRFEVELEFVQCLASPVYLNFLAQNEYFDDPDFIAYLKYLLYWKEPKYAKFIVFPHALSFLHLLQEAPFRENLKRSDFSFMLHQQQGFHWQYSKTMRLRSETMPESAGAEKGETDPQAKDGTRPDQDMPNAINSAAAPAVVQPNVVDVKTVPSASA